MKIPTVQLGKLKDIGRERERQNESRRLKELMKRLETMIELEREQSTAQEAA